MIVHFFLLLLAAKKIALPTNQPSPIAVTVLDVAPPPPPPAAPAAGPVTHDVEPPHSSPITQTVEQPIHDTPRERPKPKIARKPPKPHAEETAQPAQPMPAPPAAAPEAPASALAGIPGGVPGGVEGGRVGGTVGGQGDRLYRADQVASVPVPISQSLPEYPAMARARGIEGLVVVEAVVDQHGGIETNDIHVVQSIPVLDQAAVTALKQWRFRPGRDRNGDVVRVLVQVPIRFRLR